MSAIAPRFTASLRLAFLRVISATGNASQAARAAGISLSTAQRHRQVDTVFAEQWDEALECFAEDFEAALVERAMHGVRRALWYKGEPVIDPATGEQAFETIYSDSLGPVLLKAQRPERHRDRSDVKVRGQIDADIDDDALVARVEAALADRALRLQGEQPDGVRLVEAAPKLEDLL